MSDTTEMAVDLLMRKLQREPSSEERLLLCGLFDAYTLNAAGAFDEWVRAFVAVFTPDVEPIVREWLSYYGDTI